MTQRYRHLLYLLVLFFCTSDLIGQNEEEVLIITYPSTSVIKMETDVIEMENKSIPYSMKLPKGKHPVQVWAPHYVVKNDTIEIDNNINRFNVVLKQRSQEYKLYKKALRKNTFTRISHVAISAALITVNAAGASYAIDNKLERELNDLAEQAEIIRQEHQLLATADDFAESRANFERIQNEYHNGRDELHKKRAIGIPIVSVTSVVSAALIYKMFKKKLVKPILPEDDCPFVVDDILFRSDRNQTAIGINLRF